MEQRDFLDQDFPLSSASRHLLNCGLAQGVVESACGPFYDRKEFLQLAAVTGEGTAGYV